jgi:hypothetical protein
VDDIFIIYNSALIMLDCILNTFNRIDPTAVLFKVTLEKNDQIVFLDLTLKKVSNKITFDVCRKPTNTNLTIKYQLQPSI